MGDTADASGGRRACHESSFGPCWRWGKFAWFRSFPCRRKSENAWIILDRRADGGGAARGQPHVVFLAALAGGL